MLPPWGGNPVAFVLSENLHRRHLTQIQQAAIVALAQDWTTAASHGGNNKASVHMNTCSTTTAERAAMAGVGHMTQRRADTIAKASPELAKTVAHVDLTTSDALRPLRRAILEEPLSVCMMGPQQGTGAVLFPFAEATCIFASWNPY